MSEENLASSVISRGPHIQATVIALVGNKGENQKSFDVVFLLSLAMAVTAKSQSSGSQSEFCCLLPQG